MFLLVRLGLVHNLGSFLKVFPACPALRSAGPIRVQVLHQVTNHQNPLHQSQNLFSVSHLRFIEVVSCQCSPENIIIMQMKSARLRLASPAQDLKQCRSTILSSSPHTIDVNW